MFEQLFALLWLTGIHSITYAFAQLTNSSLWSCQVSYTHSTLPTLTQLNCRVQCESNCQRLPTDVGYKFRNWTSLEFIQLSWVWTCASAAVTQFSIPTVEWVELKQYDDVVLSFVKFYLAEQQRIGLLETGSWLPTGAFEMTTINQSIKTHLYSAIYVRNESEPQLLNYSICTVVSSIQWCRHDATVDSHWCQQRELGITCL